MNDEIYYSEFRDLRPGDSFYFIKELLQGKKGRCVKQGSHRYFDKEMKVHTIWFTRRHVYGPVFKARDEI